MTMLIALPTVAFAMALLVLEAPPRIAPQQPTEQLPDETWSISGRVTDRETGQPLPRARVGVYSGRADLRAAPLRATVTDARGFYELANLPSGNYMVMAQPPPNVATHLPQVHGIDAPFDPSSAGFLVPQTLKGQHLRNLDIPLVRSGAIEGRVVNADGDPLASIAVSINRTDRSYSEPIVRLTDDHGVFRHFGLPPGRYRVCASAPAGPSGSAPGLRRGCYMDGQESVELGAYVVSGVEIRMTPGVAATVSGIVLDAAGGPLEQGHLELIEDNGGDRKSLPIERLPGGRFVVRNVERGTYRLTASRRAASPLERVVPELATVPIRVDGDIESLVVRTKAGVGVSGVVVFEDGAPAPGPGKLLVHARSEQLFAGAISSGSGPMMMSQSFAVVRPDSSFQIEGVLGPVRIGVSGQPSGWLVKSVTYRGRDIADAPMEFEAGSEPQALTILLTNRVATVAGRVAASTTRPRAVMLIVSDRSRWTSRAAVVATTSVKDDGTFSLAPVLAGQYYIVASGQMNWMAESGQNVAAAIERLTAGGATMLMLAEGEKRQLTLYVADDR